MMHFLRTYRLILVRTFGILFLIVAGAMMFWNMQKQPVIEEDSTYSSTFERTYSSPNIITRKKPTDLSAIGTHVKERSATQSQTLLIVLFVTGLVMLGYSFMMKKES